MHAFTCLEIAVPGPICVVCLAADFHTSSGVAGVAAQLLQQPPATPAERAGLCKVLPAAEWLLEKFFRDASVSWLDDAEGGLSSYPPSSSIDKQPPNELLLYRVDSVLYEWHCDDR